MFPHQLIHIRPGRKDPLAPGILSLVEELIENLDSQMRHSYFIDIRKAHGKADRNIPVFIDCMHFISQIPRRFLHLQ